MGKRVCIRCAQELRLATVGGVEVDLCPGCGGLWLDREELQQLAEMPNEELRGLQDLVRKGGEEGNPYRQAAWADRSDRERLDIPCPGCGVGKLTHALVGNTQLEICSGCAGVFLDAGELEQAIGEVRDRPEKLATVAAMARSVTTRGTIG